MNQPRCAQINPSCLTQRTSSGVSEKAWWWRCCEAHQSTPFCEESMPRIASTNCTARPRLEGAVRKIAVQIGGHSEHAKYEGGGADGQPAPRPARHRHANHGDDVHRPEGNRRHPLHLRSPPLRPPRSRFITLSRSPGATTAHGRLDSISTELVHSMVTGRTFLGHLMARTTTPRPRSSEWLGQREEGGRRIIRPVATERSQELGAALARLYSACTAPRGGERVGELRVVEADDVAGALGEAPLGEAVAGCARCRAPCRRRRACSGRPGARARTGSRRGPSRCRSASRCASRPRRWRSPP